MALQIPATIVAESAEGAISLAAGGELPEALINIYNGAKQKVTKGYLGGERQQYSVIRRVWFCPAGTESNLNFLLEAT